MRDGKFCRVDIRHKIAIDRLAPLFLGEALECAWNHAADVVDENVATAQRSDGAVDKGAATFLGHEVDCDRNGLNTKFAQFGHGLIETLASAGANGHIATFLGKRFRYRKANALTAARDQRIFVLKPEVHGAPSQILLREVSAFLTNQVQVIWVVIKGDRK